MLIARPSVFLECEGAGRQAAGTARHLLAAHRWTRSGGAFSIRDLAEPHGLIAAAKQITSSGGDSSRGRGGEGGGRSDSTARMSDTYPIAGPTRTPPVLSPNEQSRMPLHLAVCALHRATPRRATAGTPGHVSVYPSSLSVGQHISVDGTVHYNTCSTSI